jgi:hypothetical protein
MVAEGVLSSAIVDHRRAHHHALVPVRAGQLHGARHHRDAAARGNLSSVVDLGWDLGRTVRARLKYTFRAPASTVCDPR